MTRDYKKSIYLKGHEPLSHILGIAEESIFDFMSLINGGDENPKQLFEDIDEYLMNFQKTKSNRLVFQPDLHVMILLSVVVFAVELLMLLGQGQKPEKHSWPRIWG